MAWAVGARVSPAHAARAPPRPRPADRYRVAVIRGTDGTVCGRRSVQCRGEEHVPRVGGEAMVRKILLLVLYLGFQA